MSKASQERYRAAGLCIFCGNAPPRERLQSCEKCGDRQASNRRRRKAERMAAGQCVRCGSTPLVTKQHCEPCRQRHNAITLRRYEALKDKVFDAYGGYLCTCCGETEPAFLSIDHINEDGADHRREIGTDLYRWLIKQDYPEGFQVLCMNCQWGKRKYGECPHQRRP